MERLLPARGHRREDYLKTIYLLSKDGREVRVKDVAAALGVKPASVVEYLEKLSLERLIVYRKGEGVIKLTDQGLREARRVADKYEALYDFLVQVLGIPQDRARREACYAEHGLSQDTADRIRKLTHILLSCMDKCPEIRRLRSETPRGTS